MLPLSDETYKIISKFFFKEGNKETTITHKSHPHQLTLVDAGQTYITPPPPPTFSRTTDGFIDLCNACTKPIMDTMSFYMCTYACDNFMLHEWCTRLPAELKGHPGHPQHTLLLLPKVLYKGNDVDLFRCSACMDHCNGFLYNCDKCNFNIDVSCAFTHEVKHSSHPHLLSRVRYRPIIKDYCRMCLVSFRYSETSLTCKLCAFHIHPECGLLFPKTIRHKYDKHPMTLTYGPVENHGGDYFCEVCEEEFNPNAFFYHCQECQQSIHLGCVPLDPKRKAYIYGLCREGVSRCFRNIKFGGLKTIRTSHRHSEFRLLYGTESDGPCNHYCDVLLEDFMILKCQLCEHVMHLGHIISLP
ncbi:hypothetical protein E3N88_41123 [Mikania micrantha]|uniref:DC1 domain-containing protein n=1 Tax=Mikania micrantha TaxID=192012 RepID=A0A5N6LPR9_9ASTR|nr:hypothetical protein E3N88_41123 [Mikania micrantha]